MTEQLGRYELVGRFEECDNCIVTREEDTTDIALCSEHSPPDVSEKTEVED